MNKAYDWLGGRSTSVVLLVLSFGTFLAWFDKLSWEWVALGTGVGGAAKARAMWADKHGKGTGTG